VLNTPRALIQWRVMSQSSDLEVERAGESGGTCDCCGNESRTVWGNVHERDGGTVASYFVQWTVGRPIAEHPANFDLILGSWGDGTSVDDRYAVSLLYAEDEDGPSVMVIDATDAPRDMSDLAGSALRRDEVIGTPLAAAAFAIVDAIFLQDGRLPGVES